MYDPFARGPRPVGVRTEKLVDPKRKDREVLLEIWYPAADMFSGFDLDSSRQDRYPIFGGHKVAQEALRDVLPAEGPFPLVLFSHGFAGHRRQSTFYTTHLASHGYVVVAMDHAGNTLNDIVALALGHAQQGKAVDNMHEVLFAFVFDRPRDVSFVLDALAGGELSLPFELETERVGMSGHSFGGFTALVAAEHDSRIVSVVALAPAGGPGHLSARALEDALTLRFDGRVDTLFLAAERDTLLPLEGIVDVFRRTPEPARLLVLKNSDHMHFCDRVERSHEFFRVMPQVGPMREVAKRLPPMSELVPGRHGHLFANGLSLLHFDATLRARAEARRMGRDPVSLLASRQIVIEECTR